MYLVCEEEDFRASVSFSGFLKDNLNLSWCVTIRLRSEMLGIRQNLVVSFLIGESKVLET